MANKKKLYLIGIDSAPLWIIEELHKKFKMKGFESFLNDGILTNMQSTLPPITPVAWPSIYTGLKPSEHGMMDFFCIDKEYTKQLLYYDSEKHKPFWSVLAQNDLKCLVITPAIVTKLVKEKNVDLITGWPLPPRYSSKEIENIAKKFGFVGEATIEPDLQSCKIKVDEGRSKYIDSINKRAEMSKYLISKGDYDMAFVCFTETDRIQHYSLNGNEWQSYVGPLYKAISDFIEWLIKFTEEHDEESLILMVSDHGSQPIKYKFMLNAWLINNNYAALKPGIIKDMEKQQENKKSNSKEAPKIKYQLKEMLLKSQARKVIYDKLPASAKRFTGKFIGSVLSSSSGANTTRIHDFDFDMSSTYAFSSISNDPFGMIWINDKRFSKPTVKDTEKIKADIKKKLNAIKSVDGKKLVLEIHDGDKYYNKTKAFIYPDLLFEVKANYMVDVKDYSPTNLFMAPDIARSGDHTRNGIFGMVSNDKSVNTAKIKSTNLDVYNVYPTVLKYFAIRNKSSKNSLI